MEEKTLETGIKLYNRIKHCKEQIEKLKTLRLTSVTSSDDNGERKKYYFGNELKIRIKSDNQKKKMKLNCADLTETVVDKYYAFIDEFIKHYEVEVDHCAKSIEKL